MRSAGMMAVLVFGGLASGTAAADWSGKGTFGGVLARGNTETETINLNLDVENKLDTWTHKAGASMLRTVTDDITSADRWELRGESQYSLTERSYLFGALRYEDDAFTDYEYQATLSGGYGYRFITNDTTKLEGQIGAGYREAEVRLTGEQQDGIIARGALDFERKLTTTTLIYDRFLVESGSDNTFVQNALGVEVKINDTFALGLDYAVRHNTDVLPGTDKTDQVLTANLVYGLK
jgi:putative salt-induced outer membrane protein